MFFSVVLLIPFQKNACFVLLFFTISTLKRLDFNQCNASEMSHDEFLGELFLNDFNNF